MDSSLGLYFITVIVCTGVPLLMQHFAPKSDYWRGVIWRTFCVAFILGAVLTYKDAAEKEEEKGRAQWGIGINVVEKTLNDLRARDMEKKADDLANKIALNQATILERFNEKPKINGGITYVRMYPWNYGSIDPSATNDDTGILIYAMIENTGAGARLLNWKLKVHLPDKTVITPSLWGIHKRMSIRCVDDTIELNKDNFLIEKTKESPFPKTGLHSGATIWMAKNVPINAIWNPRTVFSLTVEDPSGSVHALKEFKFSSIPHPNRCIGFTVLER